MDEGDKTKDGKYREIETWHLQFSHITPGVTGINNHMSGCPYHSIVIK